MQRHMFGMLPAPSSCDTDHPLQREQGFYPRHRLPLRGHRPLRRRRGLDLLRRVVRVLLPADLRELQEEEVTNILT